MGLFVDGGVGGPQSDGQDWPYPLGLRRFYHPASFILIAVAKATASSSRLEGLIKYLTTRLEDIVDMGPEHLNKVYY